MAAEFEGALKKTVEQDGVSILAASLSDATADTLRLMVDRFRQLHPQSSVVVLGSAPEGRPLLIAAVTDDLIKRGLNAGELVKAAAVPLGGSGGGRPNLAQAGGKDASKLPEALQSAREWVTARLK